MKPKLLRRLKVFGLSVSVYKIMGLLEQGMCGYYLVEEKKIGVDAGLKGDDLEITVIHELFHAVLDRLHCAQQIPPEFAEVIVENLSRAVLDNYHVRPRK